LSGKHSILNQTRFLYLFVATDACWEHTTLNFKHHIYKLNPFARTPKIQTIRSAAAEANLFKHWMTSCHPLTWFRPRNKQSDFLAFKSQGKNISHLCFRSVLGQW